jgi:hypothetical protein
MRAGVAGSFGAQLKALSETSGFTREEIATIAATHDRRRRATCVAFVRRPRLGMEALRRTRSPRRARAACEGHPTLMLDNFEQVLDAGASVGLRT